MRKKEKKKKKELLICGDCELKTNDFYKIPTNKGNIVKCAPCYELWYSRKNRIIIDYINDKTAEEF